MSHPLATPKSSGFRPGFPPSQIRALIALREEKIEEIGLAIAEDPKRISETIDRVRRNERIRLKLCAYLNRPYGKLWGEEPITANVVEASG